ncbi:hypothetical protein [Cellvibrio sp. UBA7661]|uniref:hypothetical protein n=1 Tax=Cellvibrio sp. UBA7661 TaxID=1946311 RepID=UPI002F360EB3
MKKIISLVIGTLFVNILIIKTANANECWRIERQLRQAEYKLQQGGDQSYMKMWQQSRDHNAKELPKCLRRFNAGPPLISVATGKKPENNNRYNEEPISIDTDNPQLQQVIKTCNYWIQQHNQYGSEHTRNLRNMACEHVNRTRREIEQNQGKAQEAFIATRSLKECVKPNNKIDDDVKLCMQGLKEPEWVTKHRN